MFPRARIGMIKKHSLTKKWNKRAVVSVTYIVPEIRYIKYYTKLDQWVCALILCVLQTLFSPVYSGTV